MREVRRASRRVEDGQRRYGRPARRSGDAAPLGRDRDQRLTLVSVGLIRAPRSSSSPPRAALALLALVLVLLVATLMGGLAPGPAVGRRELRAVCGRARRYPRQLSALDPPGRRSIRPGLERARRDLLDRERLRASQRPRRPVGENFAGAGGPGQFLEGTWLRYGVDGDGDGVKDRYNPADAIPGTANLLRHNGAPTDYRRAIFAYNHASWYVDDVLSRAARYRGAGRPDRTRSASSPSPTSRGAGVCERRPGPANLGHRRQAALARRHIGRSRRGRWPPAAPTEPVDARIYDDVALGAAPLRPPRVRRCEAGHHTHGDGTARRPRAGGGTTQADWDATAGRFAHDLGWTRAAAAPAPARRARSSRRSSGSATTATRATARHAPARGGCPAHIHVSWVSGCYGSSALVAPCGWVMAFPVPASRRRRGRQQRPGSGRRRRGHGARHGRGAP